MGDSDPATRDDLTAALQRLERRIMRTLWWTTLGSLALCTLLFVVIVRWSVP